MKTKSCEQSEKHRLANLDGSPFGTRGVGRFLRTPAVQAQLVASLFSAAALALAAPQGQKLATLAAALFINAPLCLATARWIGARNFKAVFDRFSSPDFQIVVDKRGHYTMADTETHRDSSSCIDLAGNYARALFKQAVYTAILPTFAWLALGNDPVAAVCIAGTIPAYIAIQGGYSLNLRNKLAKGAWKLSYAPPSPL